MRTVSDLFDVARPGRLQRAVAATPAVLLAAALAVGVLPAQRRAAPPARRTFASLALSTAFSVPDLAPGTSAEAQPLPKRLVAPRALPPRAAAPGVGSRLASRGRAGGWSTATVSWYGPGFYGKTMAGGGTLRRDSMVVAHRSLPFGTRVMFEYRGRTAVAVVRDRGPYAGGRTFDLGPGTARALGFSGVGRVRYRVLGR